MFGSKFIFASNGYWARAVSVIHLFLTYCKYCRTVTPMCAGYGWMGLHPWISSTCLYLFLFYFFKLWKYDNTITGDLENTEHRVPLYITIIFIKSILFTKSCLTLCDPIDCSTPSFPALHYLPEFTQTHVRWVGDAIQT